MQTQVPSFTVTPPTARKWERYDRSLLTDRTIKIGYFPQMLIDGIWKYCRGFGPSIRKGFVSIENCETYLSQYTTDDVYRHRIKEAAV